MIASKNRTEGGGLGAWAQCRNARSSQSAYGVDASGGRDGGGAAHVPCGSRKWICGGVSAASAS